MLHIIWRTVNDMEGVGKNIPEPFSLSGIIPLLTPVYFHHTKKEFFFVKHLYGCKVINLDKTRKKKLVRNGDTLTVYLSQWGRTKPL